MTHNTRDSRIETILHELYGQVEGRRALEKIEALLSSWPQPDQGRGIDFSQSDMVLITYGDSLRDDNRPPLRVLYDFALNNFKDVFSAIHILPFYPYSSDDGFAVVDYKQVDPALGSWEEISRFGDHFQLMFDFVLNHISSQSPWFKAYLEGRPGFENLAIEITPATDISRVVRPRALPLATTFRKADGTAVDLWTTFSPDQVDLNFQDVEVLVRMIEVMLYYVRKGARILRLDAVAYLWKESGTSCIHLPQTHKVIQLLRAILDRTCPEVVIITETNVPHQENISYFGDGRNEAQMVYNFTLPPMLLYTFLTQDTLPLSSWAAGLKTPSDQTAFFNFTASHDGIGVRPLEGILAPEAIDILVRAVKQNGGLVSYKANSDGSRSPYELNITYVDAMKRPGQSEDSLQPRRFLASQAIQLCLPGVPAVYIHSVLGTRNYYEGVEQSGQPRRINRRKLDLDRLMSELNDRGSFRSQIFYPYLKMLTIRKSQPAFNPRAEMEIYEKGKEVFVCRRSSRQQTIWCLVNVSDRTVTLDLQKECGSRYLDSLIDHTMIDSRAIRLEPCQWLWLQVK